MSTPISPKVIVSTIAAVAAPAILAGIAYVQTADGATLFAKLPPVLVVMIFAALTGVATLLGGYMKADPLRTLWAQHYPDPVAGGGTLTGFVPVNDPADADIPDQAAPVVDPVDPDLVDAPPLPDGADLPPNPYPAK